MPCTCIRLSGASIRSQAMSTGVSGVPFSPGASGLCQRGSARRRFAPVRFGFARVAMGGV